MEKLLPAKQSLLILVMACLLWCLTLRAQAQKNDYFVDRTYHDLTWENFVEKAESELDVRIYFIPGEMPDFRITIKRINVPLIEVLRENMELLGMDVRYLPKGNFFVSRGMPLTDQLPGDFFPEPDLEAEIPETEPMDKRPEEKTDYLNTREDYISRNVMIGTRREGFNQKTAVIAGYVSSSEDGSPVVQAVIKVEETGKYTTTNDDGFYRLELKKGKYSLSVSSMGMYEKKIVAEVRSSGTLNIRLDSRAYMLEEAVITSNVHHNVKGTQMGFEQLTAKSIREIPVVLGEKDYIKVAMLLPGIQTVGEVSSGFNVRGSPADQNLFYISELPVYNVSHLFGFFSAFNADAVNEFSLYKSNIPAKYGGRLSSIFDITARQGNADHFSARGGISPVTGRLLVEGPIKKGKASYLVGVRSTYSDWVLKQANNIDIKNSSASFADAVANLWFRIDNRNQLKIFTYGSYDATDLALGPRNNYYNAGASVQWQHDFTQRHKGNFTAIFSKYHFEEENDEVAISAYRQSFGMEHSSLRADLSYRLSDSHRIDYGLNTVVYQLHQGDFIPLTSESGVTPKGFEPEKGLENSLYIGDNWKVNKNLELSGGLRYTWYAYLGPRTVYTYKPGAPRIGENITGSDTYGENELIKGYHNLDYRLAAKYMINDEFSVKGSYNRLHQYIFLLSNTIAVSPTDKWKLVDSHIEPLAGDQFSAGLYKNFLGNSIEASVEAYYKTVNNLVEYKDGASFLVNEIPETDIIQGELDAWGIELMLKKKLGDLTGWINYTYSKTEVLVKNEITGEENNFGMPYPANYDKPHALNFVLNYRLSRRLSFSGNVVYATGRPITYPTAIYYQDGIEITHFSSRNEFRLPDYFRIDLSVNIEGNLKKSKLAHGSWSFSIYNVTGRKNAYSVYFRNEDGKIKGYKLSIFGTLIPSVTYNFKLGNYED